MSPWLALLTLVVPTALIWWAAFVRHAPCPADTAAIAALRLRELL